MIRPTPEQRAEMAAYIDAKQPGLLDDLGIKRDMKPVDWTRDLLEAIGQPYAIENVEGAKRDLSGLALMCGSAFGLDVQRHRLFESNVYFLSPPCNHSIWTPRFAQATNRTSQRRTVEIGVWRIPLKVQQQAMGIDWMTLNELSQAIPPAYRIHRRTSNGGVKVGGMTDQAQRTAWALDQFDGFVADWTPPATLPHLIDNDDKENEDPNLAKRQNQRNEPT